LEKVIPEPPLLFLKGEVYLSNVSLEFQGIVGEYTSRIFSREGSVGIKEIRGVPLQLPLQTE